MIVPGVTSVSAASAATGTPLVQGDEVLTVLPGTLPADELQRRLADTDAAVVMKLGRTYPAVREALSATGRLDEAYYVERASTPAQRVLPAARRRRRPVPYFSLAMLPGGPPRREHAARQRRGGRARARRRRLDHPQGRRELAAATDLVGYSPYLDRVGTRAASAAMPATTPTNPRAPGWRAPGRAGPRGRGGVLGRPGRVRDGDRGARGGQAVAGRRRCG